MQIFNALEAGAWQDIEMEINCGDFAVWGRAARVGSNGVQRPENVKVVQELMRDVSAALNGRRRSTRSCTFSGDWIETPAGVTAIIAGLAEIRKDMSELEATTVNFRFPDEGWYRTLTRWDDTSAAFRQICQTIVASGTDWIREVQIDDQTRDNVGCWVLGEGVSYLLGKGQIRSLTHAVAAPDPARQRFYSDITAGRVWGAYSGDFNGYPEHLTLRRSPCDGAGLAMFLQGMRKNTRTKSLTLLDWVGLSRDETHLLLLLLDQSVTLERLTLHSSHDDPSSDEHPALFPQSFNQEWRQRRDLKVKSLTSLNLSGWYLNEGVFRLLSHSLSQGTFSKLKSLTLRTIQCAQDNMRDILTALASEQGPGLTNLHLEGISLADDTDVSALVDLLSAANSPLERFTLINCAISLAQRTLIMSAALSGFSMRRVRILDENGELTAEQVGIVRRTVEDSTRLLSVDVRDIRSDPFEASQDPVAGGQLAANHLFLSSSGVVPDTPSDSIVLTTGATGAPS